MAVRFPLPPVLATVVACLLSAAASAGQAPAQPADGVARVVAQFERALATGQAEVYLAAMAADADRRAAAQFMASMIAPDATRVVVREQDRAVGQLAGRPAARVIVEVFTESGPRARVTTCRLDLRRAPAVEGEGDRWDVTGQEQLTNLNGLYRLGFDAGRSHAARGLVVEAEDLRLQWQEGTAFVIDAGGRPTGLLLVGKGDVLFAPSPASERGQMRIFAGADQLQGPVDAVYLRFNPGEFEAHVKGLGAPVTADPRDAKRAEDLFREHGGQSYVLDVGELSRESWSLLPREGDFLAEIGTRRFGTLTYIRSTSDAEDITLSDRRTRRNIAQYASHEKLAAQGPYYDEDAFAEYRVTHYDIDAQFLPDRGWMSGRADLHVVVTAPSVTNMVVRLAESLSLRSVTATGMGRVMALRVRGHNGVVLTLPRTVVRGTEFTLSFTYDGSIADERVDGGYLDRQSEQRGEEAEIEIETSYVFSQHVCWYPQPQIPSYATAAMRVVVPDRYAVVGSGDPIDSRAAEAPELKRAGLRRFAFEAGQPLRYLACAISPLVRVTTQQVHLSDAARTSARAERPGFDTMTVTVSTNRREQAQGRTLASLAADVTRFYANLIGDFPYASLNVALIEHPLPGGHSPAYMAAINYVSPAAGVTWRHDPANIDGFPEYFVAHELAHQWWGQAVGWKNYHEQWLSEGFAQYFAALYAEHVHGPALFQDILRQWQQWATDTSDQGAVYMGYRVGHIKGDQRVFRAVVYNKGAAVLHLLRRFVGDEAFFRGLRRFYQEQRFRKAGTDDLQRALEAESHLPLQRFFDRWIRGDTLPRLRVATRTEAVGAGEELVVRLEQTGEVFDLPLTVTVDCAGGTVEVTMHVADARQEFRIPLKGQLRKVDLNRTHAVPFSDLVVSAGARVAVRPVTRAPGLPGPS